MSAAQTVTQACTTYAMGWPNAVAIVATCAFGAAVIWAVAWMVKD